MTRRRYGHRSMPARAAALVAALVSLVLTLVLTLVAVPRAAAHAGPVVWNRSSSPVTFVFLPSHPRLREITIADDGAAADVTVDSLDVETPGWTSHRIGGEGWTALGPAAAVTVTIRLRVTAHRLGHVQIRYVLRFDDGTTARHDGTSAFHLTSLTRTGEAPPSALALRTDDAGTLAALLDSPGLIGAVALAAGLGALARRRRHRG